MHRAGVPPLPKCACWWLRGHALWDGTRYIPHFNVHNDWYDDWLEGNALPFRSLAPFMGAGAEGFMGEHQCATRAPCIFFFSIPHPCLSPPPPPSPNNLENLLAVSKNLAHPLHPVYDDGKGGGWKWWE